MQKTYVNLSVSSQQNVDCQKTEKKPTAQAYWEVPHRSADPLYK